MHFYLESTRTSRHGCYHGCYHNNSGRECPCVLGAGREVVFWREGLNYLHQNKHFIKRGLFINKKLILGKQNAYY